MTKCPPHLFSPLIKIVIEEIRKACKKQPINFGFNSTDNAYEPLKLMQAVMAKTNEVCLRYLDNSMLCSLPTPSNVCFETSIYAVRNKRRKMEDRHVAIHDLNTMFNIQEASPSSYYAIFDGHAGHDAAAYSSAHLHQFLAENKYFMNNPEQALLDAFCKTDALFLEKCKVENLNGGTTAVVALLRPKEKTLYIAWVGDSQALLVKQGQILQCVNPHKPCREDERERIEKSGGCVMLWGTWRVNGQLAVSRAIGDADYKPHVIAIPDVREISLDGCEDFLIIACDGLWDYVTEDAAAQEVYYLTAENPDDTERISKHLSQLARYQGSTDNISVIVVFLREPHKIAAEAHRWATRNGPPLTTDNMEAGLDNANNPFTNSNGSLKNLDVETDNIHLQKSGDGLLLNLTDNFKANGTDLSQDIFEKSNGTKNSSSDIHFDDGFGPETDVDAVDDAFSPVEKTKTFAECLSKGFNDEGLPKSFNDEVKAFNEGLANNNPLGDDFNPFLSKEDRSEEDKKLYDSQEHGGDDRDETPTPPIDTVHDVGGLEENPAESDSEDEWNYFKGDQAKPDTLSSQPETVVETSELEDAMSQLNPNAAEFVPVSPTRSNPSPASRALINDEIIAQSPKRPPNRMDIKVPNETDFESEVKSRPSDFDAYSNGHDSEHNISASEQIENILNGRSLDDIPEFQPGSTPAKPSADEFHFGPNAAPFTPRSLDQSEALSTKANYGDDTEHTLNTSFNDSELVIPHKDLGDPMSISFSAERGESNPFQDEEDLDKVHKLPENLDEFLGNIAADENKENRILDDTISDLPEHDVLGHLDNDRAAVQTTDLDKISQDDEKELASPLEPEQDDFLDLERNLNGTSKTPDSNLLEGFVVVSEKVITDNSNISSLLEAVPSAPSEPHGLSPILEPRPESADSSLSPLPEQLDQQPEEAYSVSPIPEQLHYLPDSNSPLPEGAEMLESKSPVPFEQEQETLQLVSPIPDQISDLPESNSPLPEEVELLESKSPVPTEQEQEILQRVSPIPCQISDLPGSKSPLPEAAELLQSISPVPIEQEQDTVQLVSPILDQISDLPESISPLPEAEQSLQSELEQEAIQLISPIPDQTLSDLPESKSPLQKEVELLESKSPVPSEVELLESKSPVPSEVELLESKSPVPSEVELLESKSPVPSEVELLESKSPVPSEVELLESKSPVPSEVELLTSKSPVPSEVELLTSKSPVPSEVELLESKSPVPSEVELLTSKSPVPSEVELLESKSPVPSEIELLESKSPVPNEVELLESKSPVPSEVELLESKSPVPSEVELLESKSPVPNEVELLESKSPVPIEQEQELVQQLELCELRLPPSQPDLEQEIHPLSPSPDHCAHDLSASKSPIPEEAESLQSKSPVPIEQEADNLQQELELSDQRLSPLPGQLDLRQQEVQSVSPIPEQLADLLESKSPVPTQLEPESLQDIVQSSLDVENKQIEEGHGLHELESQGLACEFTSKPTLPLNDFEESKSPVCELRTTSDMIETEFNPKSEVEHVELEVKRPGPPEEVATSLEEFAASLASDGVCQPQQHSVECFSLDSHSPFDAQHDQKQEDEVTSSVKDDISSPIELLSPVKSPEPLLEQAFSSLRSDPAITEDNFSQDSFVEKEQEVPQPEISSQEVESRDLLGDSTCSFPSSQPQVETEPPVDQIHFNMFQASAPLAPSTLTEIKSNGLDNFASEFNQQFSIKTDNIKPEFAEPTIITPSEDSKMIDEVFVSSQCELPVREPSQIIVTSPEPTEASQEAPKELPALSPLPIVPVAPQETKEIKKEEKKSSTAVPNKRPIGKVAPSKSTGHATPKVAAQKVSPKVTSAPRPAARVPSKTGPPKTTTPAAIKSSTTTAAAAPKPSKPKTATTLKPTEKKPIANGDLKPAPRLPITKRPLAEPKTLTRPATTAAAKTSPTKTTAAARPTTAPRTALTKTTTSTTAPKLTASATTTAKPRVPLASRPTTTTTTKLHVASTAATKSPTPIAHRASLSPKTALPPKPSTLASPKPKTLTHTAPKPRPPITKTITKSADVEKEKKESANKLTASRSTTVTKTASSTATSRTTSTTVRKTETKPLSHRTAGTKSSTTTTKTTVSKKPGEIKSVTKTTKVEKPKENGIAPTIITEEIKEITIVNNVVNDTENLLKDISPLDNKLISESTNQQALIDVNPAD